MRKRQRLAPHHQQHGALPEEPESEELLSMGSWAVPGELQHAAGERPKQALQMSTMIKQGRDGQRLAFGSHLLSEKKIIRRHKLSLPIEAGVGGWYNIWVAINPHV